MTDKLAGKLDYAAATRAAIAKWMDVGAKKPKRDYRKAWKTTKDKAAPKLETVLRGGK